MSTEDEKKLNGENDLTWSPVTIAFPCLHSKSKSSESLTAHDTWYQWSAVSSLALDI